MFPTHKVGFQVILSFGYKIRRSFCIASNLPRDGNVLRRISKKEYKLLSLEERHEIAKERIKLKNRMRKERKNASFALLSFEEQRQIRHETKMKRDLSIKKLQHYKKHGLHVCVDMALNSELHTKHDDSSLMTQLACGYSFMKKCETPFHLIMCSLNNKLKEQFYLRGFNNWCADIYVDNPLELMNKMNKDGINSAYSEAACAIESDDATLNSNCLHMEKTATPMESEQNSLLNKIDEVIMLSPDAKEVITTLEYNKLYIVCGIVDRTVQNAIGSSSLARSYNIKSMRLPIQEYIPNRQTHILNVDTMMKIFCLYPQHKGNWKLVLEEAMPKRKQTQKEKKI